MLGRPKHIAAMLLSALLASAAGCGHHVFMAPPGAPPPADSVMLDNPLFVPANDAEFLWQQVVDEVDDYFKIAREDRVRVVGGVVTEGRIETYPTIGSTIFEPWKSDSTAGFERHHSTLQSLRRRAVVRVTPASSGYAVQVAVFKELEDVDRPEHATVGGVTLRHDGSLARVALGDEEEPTTLGWIPLGRDVSLEQRIVANLRNRLAPPGVPVH